VATKELVSLQIDDAETSLVEPSEYVRVEESFVEGSALIKTLSFAGKIASVTGTGGPTSSKAVFEISANEAVIVTVPGFNVVAIPDASIVATVGSDVVQTTLVRGIVLPSEYLPTALNC
jgi:hypothetical protein